MSEPIVDAVTGDSGYALIVGVSQYRHAKIPKLEYTHADAQALHDLIVDPRRAGFPPGNVKMLLDEDATLYNIKNAISGWLFQQASSDSTVVVFFAGHGHTEPDKTGYEKDGMAKYLLPWDADIDNLFASALSQLDFDQLLRTVRAQRLVIFLDACHSGGLPQRSGARDLGAPDLSFERLAQGKGRLVIAAAQPAQQSWEDPNLGHGIFTHHLIEALEGKADSDKDGYVSIMEVYKYLEHNVPQSARRLKNSVQEPLLSGDISKDIVLTADKERIRSLAREFAEAERGRKEKLREKERRLFELREQDRLPLDVFQEALSLLAKEPGERTAKENTLAGYLDALLRDAIPPELYLSTREALRSGVRVPSPELREAIKSREPRRPAADVEGGTPKFCRHCGTRVRPENAFCNGCGKRVRA